MKTIIEPGEDTWVTLQGAEVTCSADTTVYQAGLSSAKMVNSADVIVGPVAYRDLTTPVEIRQKGDIRFWARSSVALDAFDYRLGLARETLGANIAQYIDFPAMLADTWYLVTTPVKMGGYGYIFSVILEQMVDKGAMDIYIDEIYQEDALVDPSATIHTVVGWIVMGIQNQLLVSLPPHHLVLNTGLYVAEAFNAVGADDKISFGYMGDTDAYVKAIDVTTTGVKTLLPGDDFEIPVDAARDLLLYLTYTGVGPTTGKALALVNYVEVPPTP